MMKLYSGDLSPYAARVRMQIYAKGITDIAFELPPTFMTLEYREENPIGRVPVLAIGDDRIPESGVIAEYLEELYPEPSLLGATPRETAHIRTIARIGDIYLLNNLFMLAGQRYAKEPNQGIVDLLAGQIVRNTKALDAMIGKDGFACSGRLTLADCTIGSENSMKSASQWPGWSRVRACGGRRASATRCWTRASPPTGPPLWPRRHARLGSCSSSGQRGVVAALRSPDA